MRTPYRSLPWPARKALAAAIATGLAIALPLNAQAQRRNVALPPPTPAPAPAAATSADANTQALLDRIDELERRLATLEQTAVISQPKVLVKEVHVWVDDAGNVYDHAVPGAKEQITYERELAQRRETIEDSIDEKLAEEAASGVEIGINNVTTLQFAHQTKGPDAVADGHAYGLSAADITFAANSAALNTEFYADLVGIGGSPPEQEIDALNLLNGQTARLSNNQLSVREAWLRTELAHQRLGLSIGRIDVTTHFDRNAAANDETTQFISDALVNNPVLGLASNGFGTVAEWDPKKSWNFKFGLQQSTDPTNQLGSLADSMFKLAEFEYIARPFGLPEGHYRVWARSDNSGGLGYRDAYGVSIDQKVAQAVTLFARYGNGEVGDIPGKEYFYSGGVEFGAPHTFNPEDFWGIGIAHTDFELGPSEKLAEVFYNLHLTTHLRSSFMLQYVEESATGEGYLIPGARIQVVF
ncbi:MAG TPA: carbohydrate porin [Gammaproteobacteria bacterium]|nr:carbohydrate porin [Gammaproteobacteria bacterium]